MHAGRHYSLREILFWTRRDLVLFSLLGVLPVAAYLAGVALPPMPWQPTALLGTAVAFMTGFKSNAAYGRLWEARQVWGAIVNASRSWAVLSRDFLDLAHGARVAPGTSGEAIARRLVYRHLAWITALRHQLRETRAWETTGDSRNVEYRRRTFQIPERCSKIEDSLAPFLSESERDYVLARKNRATAILSLQSSDLRGCVEAGRLSEYRHVELAGIVSLLYEQQGKCERIKNFPYPRQFATLNFLFVCLFLLMLPFSVLTEFLKLEPGWAPLTAPITLLVAWVFHTMDKIGEASENPFEGGPNDVPITQLSRTIEIDLRELIGESDLPPPLTPVHNIVM
jgi:ion channel-forming bestrophin family protein